MWCIRAVNLTSLFLLAVSRTRSSALGASLRLSVRDAFCCSEFPGAKPLPSVLSAAAVLALFEDFSGTIGLSDFPGWFIIGLRPETSRHVPSRALLGPTWDLPVPIRSASVRAQGLRPRGTPLHLALAMHRMLPSASRQGVGIPELGCFAAQYPGPYFPLSTLQLHSCE